MRRKNKQFSSKSATTETMTTKGMGFNHRKDYKRNGFQS